jgi:hypothetical protein
MPVDPCPVNDGARVGYPIGEGCGQAPCLAIPSLEIRPRTTYEYGLSTAQPAPTASQNSGPENCVPRA